METTWSYKIGYHMEIIINNPTFECKSATKMSGKTYNKHTGVGHLHDLIGDLNDLSKLHTIGNIPYK